MIPQMEKGFVFLFGFRGAHSLIVALIVTIPKHGTSTGGASSLTLLSTNSSPPSMPMEPSAISQFLVENRSAMRIFFSQNLFVWKYSKYIPISKSTFRLDILMKNPAHEVILTCTLCLK